MFPYRLDYIFFFNQTNASKFTYCFPIKASVSLVRDEFGEFREATWDEALDLVAGKLAEVKDQYGARSIMGLASALFALRIPYNSEEGFDFIKKVCEHLTYFAMLASAERARQRGVFPEYEKSSYVKGELPVEGFYHRELWSLNWEKLRELILKHGIRNVELTTIAPTGSISMFLLLCPFIQIP